MKRLLTKLLRFYYCFPIWINSLIFKNDTKAISICATEMCEAINNKGKYYCSYRMRPQKVEYSNEVIEVNRSEICILIQGPFFGEFTLESIKFYRKFYPDVMIVVSTWKGLQDEIKSALEKYNVIVVESDEPLNAGRLNINYQIISTRAGIDKAIENKAKYICKVRSDQRFYNPSALMYLCGLINSFPVGKLSNNQNKRIIAVAMPYGSMFQPFYISDFFYFGWADDIKRLFSLPLDDREKGGFSRGLSKIEAAEKNMAPESIIMRYYARVTGQSDECSISAYWNFVINSLICISRNDVGLFWNKYKEKNDDAKWNGYFDPLEEKGEYSLYNFDFCNWLSLYTGELIYNKNFEKYAEFKFKK